MYTYCLNNPVNHSDSSGESAVAEELKNALWILPLLDGPIPLGDIITAIVLAGVLLYDEYAATDGAC